MKGYDNMEIIFEKIRRSYFFNKILECLGIIGIDKICIRIMYKWFEKHPTQAMMESIKFYEEHIGDIEYNKSLLADEKSKQIYERMIDFRKTMKYGYHPGMELPQYFVKDIISYGKDEVFIDCGGYDGKTSVDFIHEVENKFKKIVIFEPDFNCESMIKKNLPNDERIVLIKKGVWNENTELEFVASGDSASHVVENNNNERVNKEFISVVAIDECDECKDATFIKMDLEGAEMKALEGARETIIRNRPKLAICIYHSDEDMLNIIRYIHDLVPEYKLYVRHHSRAAIETVLYAV